MNNVYAVHIFTTNTMCDVHIFTTNIEGIYHTFTTNNRMVLISHPQACHKAQSLN